MTQQPLQPEGVRPTPKRRRWPLILAVVAVLVLLAGGGTGGYLLAKDTITTPSAAGGKPDRAEKTPKAAKVDCEDENLTMAEWTDNCQDGPFHSDDDIPEGESDMVEGFVGTPFKMGSFEVTITNVEFGVKELPYDEVDRNKNDNGQYVVAHVKAKNIDAMPAAFSTTMSTLFDQDSRMFDADVDMPFPPQDQNLGSDQQPDTTETGYLIFDVPKTVTGWESISVQPDDMADDTYPTATVFPKT